MSLKLLCDITLALLFSFDVRVLFKVRIRSRLALPHKRCFMGLSSSLPRGRSNAAVFGVSVVCLQERIALL